MALDLCIWPEWGRYNYASEQECFDDRRSPEIRVVWHDLISLYNVDDPARLGKQIYTAYDVYCGLRCDKEFNEMRRISLFDYSVWIDASERLPLESRNSCKVSPDMCDFVIDNNGTEEEFLKKIADFSEFLGVKRGL